MQNLENPRHQIVKNKKDPLTTRADETVRGGQLQFKDHRFSVLTSELAGSIILISNSCSTFQVQHAALHNYICFTGYLAKPTFPVASYSISEVGSWVRTEIRYIYIYIMFHDFFSALPYFVQIYVLFDCFNYQCQLFDLLTFSHHLLFNVFCLCVCVTLLLFQHRERNTVQQVVLTSVRKCEPYFIGKT